MSGDDEIRVFKTAVGLIAIPLARDSLSFEAPRIAWLRGAEIMIALAGAPSDDDLRFQTGGMWSRVQRRLTSPRERGK
jgi:hypothetical protein